MEQAEKNFSNVRNRGQKGFRSENRAPKMLTCSAKNYSPFCPAENAIRFFSANKESE
jgi:hypothetical protein